MGKSMFVSRTLWFNGLSLLATGAGFLSGNLSAHPEVVTALVLIQALANILLRFVTKKPLVMTKKSLA